MQKKVTCSKDNKYSEVLKCVINVSLFVIASFFSSTAQWFSGHRLLEKFQTTKIFTQSLSFHLCFMLDNFDNIVKNVINIKGLKISPFFM